MCVGDSVWEGRGVRVGVSVAVGRSVRVGVMVPVGSSVREGVIVRVGERVIVGDGGCPVTVKEPDCINWVPRKICTV